MPTTLTLQSNNGKNIGQYLIEPNATVRIEAQDAVYYHLADAADQQAPEDVVLEQRGEDLYVRIDGDSTLITENFYRVDPSGNQNPILGMGNDGMLYAYSVSSDVASHLFAGEVATANETAGNGVPTLGLVAGITGLGLIGAAIASSGSDDTTSNSTPNPQAAPPL